MNLRKSLLTVALAGAFAAPFAAYAADIHFNVDIAPPAPIVEQLAPRAGYVVIPGYYRFDAKRHAHVWVKGRYERARRGQHYVAPEWQQRDGHWGLGAGHWDHDK